MSELPNQSNPNIESAFTFDELFFSRTDHRGVIISGNSVFLRVSEYDWQDLIDTPHSVIRHEDMPRGVFHLFWEIIKSGQPIGAYVKNKSKQGKYYWVYALALPIESGYISIRIKPSSSLLSIVEKEYKKLIQLEKDQKLSPKASQDILLADLASLNFKSYFAFMVTSLKAELESRQQKLGRPPIPVLVLLNEILESSNHINQKAFEVLNAYKQSEHVPLNLEITTSKIGSEAAPLAVVASNYESMARGIQIEIMNFVKSGESTREEIEQVQFRISATLLQAEVHQFFTQEKNLGPIDIETELKILTDLKIKSINDSIKSLKRVEAEFIIFENRCEALKIMSTGLELIRLTGKIEASKINDPLSELKPLLDELTKFRNKLAVTLIEIEQLNSKMKFQTIALAESIKSNPLFAC